MSKLMKEAKNYATATRVCRTKEDAENKLAAIRTDRKSTMHAVAKTATQWIATVTVEGTVINTTFAVGNTISEGLTGESLHGVGLAATAATAAVLGIGTGIRTYDMVGDAVDMIDDYREKKAMEEMHSLPSLADLPRQE